MNTAYPETITFPDGLGTTPLLGSVIEQTIRRFTGKWRLFQMPVSLQFPEELEEVYQAETANGRVRELNLTVTAAIGFMDVTTFTDRVLVPDLGWRPLIWRLMASVLLCLGVSLFGRMSHRGRELLLCAIAYTCILVVTSISLVSVSPLAPYGLMIWILALIYTNTTMPTRFQYAWPLNLACLGTVGTLIFLDTKITPQLAFALVCLSLVGSSFTLIANYRLERSQRLGYLLASKEALRLFALNRDRDKLKSLSDTDALTGIANRGRFDRRLDELFSGTLLPGTEFALIMMDVDFFKRYNDRYGHPAGDECLRSVAKVLARIIRGEDDLAFRYGGEEFGALLVGVGVGEVRTVAERIRASVYQQEIQHGAREDGLDVLTVSIGFSTTVAGADSSGKEFVARADRSLYAAKEAGRNRVRPAA